MPSGKAAANESGEYICFNLRDLNEELNKLTENLSEGKRRRHDSKSSIRSDLSARSSRSTSNRPKAHGIRSSTGSRQLTPDRSPKVGSSFRCISTCTQSSHSSRPKGGIEIQVKTSKTDREKTKNSSKRGGGKTRHSHRDEAFSDDDCEEEEDDDRRDGKSSSKKYKSRSGRSKTSSSRRGRTKSTAKNSDTDGDCDSPDRSSSSSTRKPKKKRRLPSDDENDSCSSEEDRSKGGGGKGGGSSKKGGVEKKTNRGSTRREDRENSDDEDEESEVARTPPRSKKDPAGKSRKKCHPIEEEHGTDSDNSDDNDETPARNRAKENRGKKTRRDEEDDELSDNSSDEETTSSSRKGGKCRDSSGVGSRQRGEKSRRTSSSSNKHRAQCERVLVCDCKCETKERHGNNDNTRRRTRKHEHADTPRHVKHGEREGKCDTRDKEGSKRKEKEKEEMFETKEETRHKGRSDRSNKVRSKANDRTGGGKRCHDIINYKMQEAIISVKPSDLNKLDHTLKEINIVTLMPACSNEMNELGGHQHRAGGKLNHQNQKPPKPRHEPCPKLCKIASKSRSPKRPDKYKVVTDNDCGSPEDHTPNCFDDDPYNPIPTESVPMELECRNPYRGEPESRNAYRGDVNIQKKRGDTNVNPRAPANQQDNCYRGEEGRRSPNRSPNRTESYLKIRHEFCIEGNEGNSGGGGAAGGTSPPTMGGDKYRIQIDSEFPFIQINSCPKDPPAPLHYHGEPEEIQEKDPTMTSPQRACCPNPNITSQMGCKNLRKTSPRRCTDQSPRRCTDQSPRRCKDQSPRRCKDQSPRRCKDPSPACPVRANITITPQRGCKELINLYKNLTMTSERGTSAWRKDTPIKSHRGGGRTNLHMTSQGGHRHVTSQRTDRSPLRPIVTSPRGCSDQVYHVTSQDASNGPLICESCLRKTSPKCYGVLICESCSRKNSPKCYKEESAKSPSEIYEERAALNELSEHIHLCEAVIQKKRSNSGCCAKVHFVNEDCHEGCE